MKKQSIWLENFPKNVSSPLNENIETDVLIIGGGITGISTAYHLINSDLKVCIVEKNCIGFGVTSKTTGKLTYLQENMASKINNYHGINTVKEYINSQKEAINIVEHIISKENIDCNFEKVNSYIFSNNDLKKLNKEKELYKNIGINVFDDKFKYSNNIYDSFYIKDSYTFHPLKYLYNLKNVCLKNKIMIYENTNITSINRNNNKYICKTNNNEIKCKYVVLAIHYPYFLKPFWLPFKSYIEKSYIEAFKVEKTYNYSAITISKPTISIRYYNDIEKYQIYLTNSHNLCIKNNESKNFEDLIYYSNNKPDYIWSNKDIITIDSLPYIGIIKDNLLIGTGYNTWGMTNGSLAGKLLSDIIKTGKCKYQDLFDPKRVFNKGSLINFPLIVGSNTYSFIKSKLIKQKFNNIRYEKRNGKKVAIYTDENKKEHIVYTLCPHVKCSLFFNEIEKTWDCPCHGSRFDIDGNVIEGPSNYNITYKKNDE